MSTSNLVIEELTAITSEVVSAWNTLLPQLSRSANGIGAEELQSIIDCDATSLLIARLDDRIVGSLTLAIFPIPTGKRAWIEDVVVDESARGQGVGEALTRAAIEVAAEVGVRTVDLTSRPTREAANRLYQRIGFKARETNVYRYEQA